MTTASSESPSSGNFLTLRVGQFEGPLDLLLHLCRTNEIDLAALPVRAITDQYVAHLEAMEFRDLETAGAYLVMAATLIYLKSKLLVPPDEADEQLDEEGEALRHELERRCGGEEGSDGPWEIGTIGCDDAAGGRQLCGQRRVGLDR